MYHDVFLNVVSLSYAQYAELFSTCILFMYLYVSVCICLYTICICTVYESVCICQGMNIIPIHSELDVAGRGQSCVNMHLPASLTAHYVTQWLSNTNNTYIYECLDTWAFCNLQTVTYLTEASLSEGLARWQHRLGRAWARLWTLPALSTALPVSDLGLSLAQSLTLRHWFEPQNLK